MCIRERDIAENNEVDFVWPGAAHAPVGVKLNRQVHFRVHLMQHQICANIASRSGCTRTLAQEYWTQTSTIMFYGKTELTVLVAALHHL